jgi:hypothetical protein
MMFALRIRLRKAKPCAIVENHMTTIPTAALVALSLGYPPAPFYERLTLPRTTAAVTV